jgi:hypothetical protein
MHIHTLMHIRAYAIWPYGHMPYMPYGIWHMHMHMHMHMHIPYATMLYGIWHMAIWPLHIWLCNGIICLAIICHHMAYIWNICHMAYGLGLCPYGLCHINMAIWPHMSAYEWRSRGMAIWSYIGIWWVVDTFMVIPDMI